PKPCGTPQLARFHRSQRRNHDLQLAMRSEERPRPAGTEYAGGLNRSANRSLPMERRTFLTSILAAAAQELHAENDPRWGGPVLDTHLHLRADADACFTHMQGCGVTHAVLLTPAADQDRAKGEMERRAGHFVRSVRTDPSLPDSTKILRD